MRVILLDGTYELFRHHFAVPSATDSNGREVGAMRGVLRSVAQLLEDGVTHLAVATDHVVESFRNELWAGYKTGEGIEPELFEQFHPLEESLTAMGVRVWAMTEFEADDALAAGAAQLARQPEVDEVWIATPDKDLAQCVDGGKVRQWDRRKDKLFGPDDVREKFGVGPASIPDYLALVGDAADGFPGLPGWGAKSTATVLAHYEHLEHIPASADDWEPRVRGAQKLAQTLCDQRDAALLFRRLATLRLDVPLDCDVAHVEWTGPRPEFGNWCQTLGLESLAGRLDRLRH